MANTTKGVLLSNTFKTEWEIERFFTDCENVGDFYESCALPICYPDKETKWYVRVYPKGKKEEAENYVSLYLYFQSENVIKVTVDYELSIASKQNCLSKLLKAKIFEGSAGSWGWPYFAEQDVIKDTKNEALIDDTLRILCKITFNQEAKTSFDGYKEWVEKTQIGFSDFETLLEGNCFSDVTFNLQDQKMYLHKSILVCRSSYFKAMFENEMKEKKESIVNITDVNYEVMRELFRFIYSGKVENIEKIAKDLLIAADKYSVTELKALCEKTLYDNLAVDNALECLQLVEMCDTIHLKKLVIKFVVDNLSSIVRKSDFKLLLAELDREVVCEIMVAVANKI